MQITLPDHVDILARAKSSGFGTVEDYVCSLIVADVSESKPSAPGEPLSSPEAWNEELEQLLAVIEPGNPNVDDSRESIYPVRACES